MDVAQTPSPKNHTKTITLLVLSLLPAIYVTIRSFTTDLELTKNRLSSCDIRVDLYFGIITFICLFAILKICANLWKSSKVASMVLGLVMSGAAFVVFALIVPLFLLGDKGC